MYDTPLPIQTMPGHTKVINSQAKNSNYHNQNTKTPDRGRNLFQIKYSSVLLLGSSGCHVEVEENNPRGDRYDDI